MPVQDREELANRGKKAEASVATFLKKTKDRIGSFDYQRQYDARSARGRFQAQVGDYLLWRMRPGPTFIREGLEQETYIAMSAALEVKQVHADARLPGKNFNTEQIAKLRRREMAGARIVIAVFHTTTQKWRCPPFQVFRDNPDASSWDLSSYPVYTSAALMLPFELHDFFTP